MDRLIAVDPEELTIHLEIGQKSSAVLQLNNLMHTMPVAFRMQTTAPKMYFAKPWSGIIPPLGATSVEISCPPQFQLPDKYPFTSDKLTVESVLVPGCAQREYVSNDWFSSKKRRVYTDSGIRIVIVGAGILRSLVSGGSMEQAREVLERGVDVDGGDKLGNTALHVAVSNRRPEMVQLLLEFGCNMETTNKAGYTALHEAASVGDALSAELLLTKGANSAATTRSGHTPLHHAAASRSVEMVRVLLQKGAAIDAVGSDGKTALCIAAANSDRSMIRLLLENGADYDAASPADGSTPLHIAASTGQQAIVMLLLSWGAEKEAVDKQGRSPFDIAVNSGFRHLYDALRLGDQLRSAARKGDPKAVRQCLQEGAEVNGQDQYGWTALHYSAFKGHSVIVSYLIHKSADVNSRDEEGYTPLHCATVAGRPDIVKLLISKGADVDLGVRQGCVAMQIASAMNFPGLMRVLSEGKPMKPSRERERVHASKPPICDHKNTSFAPKCQLLGDLLAL